MCSATWSALSMASSEPFTAAIFNNAPEVRMRFRHRWEVEPRYIDTLESAGLVFSGKDPNFPIMQVLELPQLVKAGTVAARPQLPSFLYLPADGEMAPDSGTMTY